MCAVVYCMLLCIKILYFVFVGTEFTSGAFKQNVNLRGMNLVHLNSYSKAATAERLLLSLQRVMYAYMYDQQTNNYIDVLAEIVDILNGRHHRIINMSPNEAELPENWDRVVEMLGVYYSKSVLQKHNKNTEHPLNAVVRVELEKTRFTRGYHAQFTNELFYVRAIDRRKPIVMYDLTSTATGQQIEGSYYPHELSRYRGTVFKINKTLDRRVKGGRREILVNWLNMPEDRQDWVLEKNVENINRQ